MAAPKTLLIVEDDTVAREGLGLLLRREGYDVVLASNGEEALVCLRSGPRPDLILLDMAMPVLDGWRFLEQFKSGLQPTAVPVLITTSTVISREWAEDHGCQGFVQKPIKLEALFEEIRRCLV